jgi:hypothetical protein
MIRKHAKIALIFRPLSLWIGVHHSKPMNQTCINIIPMFTIRIKWLGEIKHVNTHL